MAAVNKNIDIIVSEAVADVAGPDLDTPLKNYTQIQSGRNLEYVTPSIITHYHQEHEAFKPVCTATHGNGA